MSCEMPPSLRQHLLPEAILMLDLFYMGTTFSPAPGATDEDNEELAEYINIKSLEFMDNAEAAGFTETQLRDRSSRTTHCNDPMGVFIREEKAK